MAQYIDKDALIAEIYALLDDKFQCNSYDETTGFQNALILIKKFLDTLEVKEVDLEAELNKWRHNHFHGRRDKDASGEYLERDSQIDLAKHFFELGLRCKSSYVKLPSIDDTLKEMGVDVDSKIAKNFKELYFTALEKFKEKEHK